MKMRTLPAICLGVALCVAQNAFALSFSQFTTQAAWESAAGGSTGLVDFTTTPLGNISNNNTHFGPVGAGFTVSRTGGNIGMSIAEGQATGNVDGSNFLQFSSSGNTLAAMQWTFDTPITALGFDWKNADEVIPGSSGNKDNVEIEIKLQIGSEWVTLGNSSSSSFFGMVLTSGVTSIVALSDTPGAGNNLQYAGFDNIRFAPDTPTPTPEPGTWVLMGTGLVGLLGYGWRRRRDQAA